MKLRVIAIAAIMFVGTTSAIALVQKPSAALQASMDVDALVMQLDASLPRASSLDRAP